MANTFKLKRSAVAGKVPSTDDLQLGELALNTNDGRLFAKRDNGTATVVEIGGLKHGAGAPTFTPPNPQLYLDVTNFRLYAFDGTAWKYAQLGELTWQSGT